MLKALIFDLDGTMAETERDGHRLAFNRAFAEAGLDIEWDEETYSRLLWVSGGKERIGYFLRNCPTCPKLLDSQIASLHRRKTEIYTQMVARGEVVWRPGVLRLIHEARRAGLLLGIATTTTPDNIVALLENVDPSLPSWFIVVVSGEMVKRKKPAPDAYLRVLQGLGVEPGEAVAFEDTQNGLMAAQAAGIATVITPSYYSKEHDFSGALAVVDHLGEPDNPAVVLQGHQAGESLVVNLDRLRRWLSVRINNTDRPSYR